MRRRLALTIDRVSLRFGTVGSAGAIDEAFSRLAWSLLVSGVACLGLQSPQRLFLLTPRLQTAEPRGEDRVIP